MGQEKLAGVNQEIWPAFRYISGWHEEVAINDCIVHQGNRCIMLQQHLKMKVQKEETFLIPHRTFSVNRS